MDKKILDNLLNGFDSRNNKEIILIMNTSNKVTIPMEKGSIETEFYSPDESAQIMKGIQAAGISMTPYHDEKEFLKKWIDKENKETLVFNLARNGVGLTKKSLVPIYCDSLGIKYTGSNAYVTALGRNKFHYTLLLDDLEIRVPKSRILFKSENFETQNRLWSNDLLIIKPAYEAASRGITKRSIIENNNEKIDELVQKINCEFPNDPVIIQQFIEGYEVEVPLLVKDGHANALMAVGLSINDKLDLGTNFLDYERSANYDYSFYNYAEEDEFAAKQIMEIAEKTATILGINGYGRVDFRINAKGEAFVIDISTHPFIMEHSSFAFAMSKLGYNYSDIFKCIIECS